MNLTRAAAGLLIGIMPLRAEATRVRAVAPVPITASLTPTFAPAPMTPSLNFFSAPGRIPAGLSLSLLSASPPPAAMPQQQPSESGETIYTGFNYVPPPATVVLEAVEPQSQRVMERARTTAEALEQDGRRGGLAPAPEGLELKGIAQRWRSERALNRGHWRRRKPTTIKDEKGRDLPLTYSMDSELGNADVLRALLSHKPALRRAEAMQKASIASFTMRNLMLGFKMSRSQVERFVLRPGVDLTRANLVFTDLRPGYFAEAAVRWPKISSLLKHLRYERWVGQALNGRFPVSVDADSDGSPEVRHASWESVPSRFDKLMRRLHGLFKAPQSHLHVGVPASIGNVRATDVARAVETKLILELASSHPSNLQAQDYRESILFGRNRSGERGLIKLEFNLWDEPHASHDLEIRYHEGLSHGLETLAFASRLIAEHDRLKHFAIKPVTIVDDLTVNLPGALDYAARVLAEAEDGETRRVAADLAVFSVEMRAVMQGVDYPEMMRQRAELAEYIRTRRVRERLTADMFLAPLTPR